MDEPTEEPWFGAESPESEERKAARLFSEAREEELS